MRISLIVATASNGVIGKDNKLPWHLPADLKRFKALTTGNTLVMGRKTFEGIGRVLPDRTTIVVTRQKDFAAPDGVLVAHSLDDAFRQAKTDEVFVAGGAAIYRQALDRVERIYLTTVGTEFEGDTEFPGINWSLWHLIEADSPSRDPEFPFRWAFFIYERR